MKTGMKTTLLAVVVAFASFQVLAETAVLTAEQKKECESGQNPDLVCNPNDTNLSNGVKKPNQQTEASNIPEEQRRNGDCPACRAAAARMKDNTAAKTNVPQGQNPGNGNQQ